MLQYCETCGKSRDMRTCQSCGTIASELVLYSDGINMVTEERIIFGGLEVRMDHVLKVNIEINGLRFTATPQEAATILMTLAIARGGSLTIAKPPFGMHYYESDGTIRNEG